jgi:broad specificity phosphatase PhoE
MIKVFLTRHVETEENALQMSQSDNSAKFTKIGLSHLDLLKKRISKEKIDLIISSDLPRALHTAEELKFVLKAPLKTSILLREKSNGEWSGKKHSEINWDSLGNDFENRKPPGGESLIEVKSRALNFLKNLDNFENKTILLVTHGAFSKILLGCILKKSIRESIFNLKVDHCSLSCFEIIDGVYNLNFINNLSHITQN